MTYLIQVLALLGYKALYIPVSIRPCPHSEMKLKQKSFKKVLKTVLFLFRVDVRTVLAVWFYILWTLTSLSC